MPIYRFFIATYLFTLVIGTTPAFSQSATPVNPIIRNSPEKDQSNHPLVAAVARAKGISTEDALDFMDQQWNNQIIMDRIDSELEGIMVECGWMMRILFMLD